MSTTHTRGILTAAAAIVLAASAISITAAAQAADNPTGAGNHGDRNTALADAFNGVDRNTNWQQTSKLKLNFPTYHTEGIAYSQDHIFLSAVQIIEPTVKFPTPQNGFDRTPGKGVGHLFVMDKAGDLQKDIILGEGDMYHPGGIDFDGTNVWVPVAQYRPDSSAIIYRVDATTLDVHKQFEVKDHFGGIVMDKQTGHLVGNTWGSRRFAEWDLQGKQLSTWENPNYFIDYQDCQYVPRLPDALRRDHQPPADPGGRRHRRHLRTRRHGDDRPQIPQRNPRCPLPAVVHRGPRGHAQPVQNDGRRRAPHHEGGPRQRRGRQRHRNPHLRGHGHAGQVTQAGHPSSIRMPAISRRHP